MTQRITTERLAEIMQERQRWTSGAFRHSIELADKLQAEREHSQKLQSRLDAAVKHAGEAMRLLQWDELGWDVPEEVIESLDKCLKAAEGE